MGIAFDFDIDIKMAKLDRKHLEYCEKKEMEKRLKEQNENK